MKRGASERISVPLESIRVAKSPTPPVRGDGATWNAGEVSSAEDIGDGSRPGLGSLEGVLGAAGESVSPSSSSSSTIGSRVGVCEMYKEERE